EPNTTYMKREFYYSVSAAEDGCSVKHFLQKRGYSAAILTHLKKTHSGILRGHDWLHINDALFLGDCVHITIDEPLSSPNILPIYVPFQIVYEDEDLLVIDKPADTPIHPSINNHEHTLANGVMYYFHSQNTPFVFRCINRLDRDTTGLTIIAKNMLSASLLSAAMKRREIHREYLAVVSGIAPDFGKITAPIARVSTSTIERCVDEQLGESAVTYFYVKKKESVLPNSFICLLSLSLGTGRTHQIRVHMNSIGHPLLGDFIYNPSDSLLNRQALHSCHLDFLHPITGKHLTFDSPLPDDMAALFM
ncbi:MAG: RluA family pseudouridine synthase, partial [Lachnospiraceae bacterium]